MEKWFDIQGKTFSSKQIPSTYWEAVNKSLNKWRLISIGFLPDDDIETCGLCNLYIDLDCEGCPIFEATGLPYCEETPFIKWALNKDKEWADIELNFLYSVVWSQHYLPKE